ncbi:MAG: flagellar biosynthetic protein FliR [Spirochaetes bacterium]|nr:flagellar biosynthetic protein FliR [Spirochaetota bacterium]MBU1081743.1 flagellar biosynthetic protein FliR [Spirochaetota bacterium]
MLNEIVANADLFFVIAVRVLAMIETAPLLSGDGVPQVAKVGLAGFAAAAVFPWVQEAGYAMPANAGAYVAIVAGEAMIGIIIGFFLTMVFNAFTTAGQFFSLQMGFGASETYDPLAQIEIPVVGQFLNLIAMFVFVSTSGFQRLFIIGVRGSFQAIRAVDLLARRADFMAYVVGSLGALFQNALILAFPIFGTLLLVSVTTGLLSKAAPQINLLTEGFPISILVAFFLMATAMPFMIEAFSGLIDTGFENVAGILQGGVRGAAP